MLLEIILESCGKKNDLPSTLRSTDADGNLLSITIENKNNEMIKVFRITETGELKFEFLMASSDYVPVFYIFVGRVYFATTLSDDVVPINGECFWRVDPKGHPLFLRA